MFCIFYGYAPPKSWGDCRLYTHLICCLFALVFAKSILLARWIKWYTTCLLLLWLVFKLLWHFLLGKSFDDVVRSFHSDCWALFLFALLRHMHDASSQKCRDNDCCRRISTVFVLCWAQCTAGDNGCLWRLITAVCQFHYLALKQGGSTSLLWSDRKTRENWGKIWPWTTAVVTKLLQQSACY